MTMFQAVTLAFYILFRGGTMDLNDVPRVMGPYPSLSLCKAAGHEMFPGDPQFFTLEQAKAAQVEGEKRRAELDKLIAIEIAKLHGKAGEINIKQGPYAGTTYRVDALGHYEWSGSWSSGFIVGPPPPSAITGCMRDK